MLIEIIKEHNGNTGRGQHFVNMMILKCDGNNCTNFIKKRTQPRQRKQIRHYCSKFCYTSSEKSKKQREETFNERFGGHPMKNEEIKKKVVEIYLENLGVVNPSKSSICMEKRAQTNLKNRGVEHVFQDPVVQEKILASRTELYGFPYPMQSDEIWNRAVETWQKNLGVDHPSKNPEIHKKIEETTLKNHNVKCILTLPEIQEKAQKIIQENIEEVNQKREKTCFKNLGVTNPSFSDEVNEKRRETCNEKWGVDYYFQSGEFRNSIDWSEVWQKQHETKKRTGVYASLSSKDENRFYEWLKQNYYDFIIERWIIMFEQKEIDFKLTKDDIVIYIEFDGIFWHGLDKSLIDIAILSENSDLHYKRYNKYFEDRKLDKIFKEKELKLVRITDKEFKKCEKDNNYELIIERINGALI